jgi:hypothetical protein
VGKLGSSSGHGTEGGAKPALVLCKMLSVILFLTMSKDVNCTICVNVVCFCIIIIIIIIIIMFFIAVSIHVI